MVGWIYLVPLLLVWVPTQMYLFIDGPYGSVYRHGDHGISGDRGEHCALIELAHCA